MILALKLRLTLPLFFVLSPAIPALFDLTSERMTLD